LKHNKKYEDLLDLIQKQFNSDVDELKKSIILARDKAYKVLKK